METEFDQVEVQIHTDAANGWIVRIVAHASDGGRRTADIPVTDEEGGLVEAGRLAVSIAAEIVVTGDASVFLGAE